MKKIKHKTHEYVTVREAARQMQVSHTTAYAMVERFLADPKHKKGLVINHVGRKLVSPEWIALHSITEL